MLSKSIEDALNKQVALEATASQNYLAMASWCSREALDGCAQFLYTHAEEERMHMMKLIHYINESGGFATISGIEQPRLEFANLKELFEVAYGHELKVSKAIDELVDICAKKRDKQTGNFLTWYVNEQHEEEALYRTVLDKIKLIGIEGRGLYFIDKEVDAINKATAKAEGNA